jgi:hypothetical protein
MTVLSAFAPACLEVVRVSCCRKHGSASISVQAGGQFGTQGMQVLIKLAAAGWSHDEPRTDEPGGQIELQFQRLDQPGTGVSRMWGDQAASGDFLTVLDVASNVLPKPDPNAPL